MDRDYPISIVIKYYPDKEFFENELVCKILMKNWGRPASQLKKELSYLPKIDLDRLLEMPVFREGFSKLLILLYRGYYKEIKRRPTDIEFRNKFNLTAKLFEKGGLFGGSWNLFMFWADPEYIAIW